MKKIFVINIYFLTELTENNNSEVVIVSYKIIVLGLQNQGTALEVREFCYYFPEGVILILKLFIIVFVKYKGR